MLVCVFLCIFAHETAGAARTRLSLRPLVLFRGWQSTQTSGTSCRENVKLCLNSSLRGALATKQSILPLLGAMDFFAVRAMTLREGSARPRLPAPGEDDAD